MVGRQKDKAGARGKENQKGQGQRGAAKTGGRGQRAVQLKTSPDRLITRSSEASSATAVAGGSESKFCTASCKLACCVFFQSLFSDSA